MRFSFSLALLSAYAFAAFDDTWGTQSSLSIQEDVSSLTVLKEWKDSQDIAEKYQSAGSLTYKYEDSEDKSGDEGELTIYLQSGVVLLK